MRSARRAERPPWRPPRARRVSLSADMETGGVGVDTELLMQFAPVMTPALTVSLLVSSLIAVLKLKLQVYDSNFNYN